MIQDKDLDFLKTCSHQELDNLVHLLIYDKDQKKRVSQSLSKNKLYKKHAPNHAHYTDAIISEIQRYGGNTIANILRGGKGVLYREILEDVCRLYKIQYNKTIETEALEELLLLNILEHSLEKMNEAQRKELLHTLGVETTSFSNKAILSAVQIAFRANGFTSYKLSVVVANSIIRQLTGKGIAFVGNQTLTKSLSILSGPVGWAITSLWTVYDISGPAYRVTVPVVLEIAYLRKEHQIKKRSLWYRIKHLFKSPFNG